MLILISLYVLTKGGRRLVKFLRFANLQLKEDEIAEDLSCWDTSEPNLKNVQGKRHAANAWKTKATKNYAETM